jgi:8-amino-7-oxononanoate synthase
MQSNNINTFIEKKLKEFSKKNQLRKIFNVRRFKSNVVDIKNKKTISFSCNDYLSLSLNKEVINASLVAVKRYGVGAGASRLITGNNFLYSELEEKIKVLKKVQGCCVFGSGFLANVGVIPALVDKNDLILIDELSHASTFLGAKLSGANIIKFNHNSVNDLENKLIKYRNKYLKCLILTEGVFSMDGDISPQDKISVIKEKFNAQLLVDDAHGLGVLGDGSGSSSVFKNKTHIDIYIGTLSKAVGAYGGFVCGNKKLINFIINRCRTQIYTTGLPPGVLAACIKSIEIITYDKALIKKPMENAIYFCNQLGLNRPLSPIVPIIIGEERKTIKISKILFNEGFLVGAIRPPTVPINSSRLRIAFNSAHTKNEIKKLAGLIKINLNKYNVK